MTHINKKHLNTKLQIIQVAAGLFIDEGYSNTSFSKIAKILDISTGNITFYFKTKDHLMIALMEEMFDFQEKLLEQAADEGKTSMLAYCLELTTMVAASVEDEAARDFFLSSYTSEMLLELIRENDTEKVKKIFAQYRSDWTDEQWAAAEDVVSGIEYATIVTGEERTPLPLRIETALNTILTIYGVPEELRKIKIGKVFAIDYRELGKRVLGEFKEYINSVNKQNLKHAVRIKKKHSKE